MSSAYPIPNTKHQTPNTCILPPFHARNIALSETHIFSSRLLNQVTGGFNYVFNFMTPIGEGKNLAQQFGIPGANLGDPENSTLPQINPALGFTSLCAGVVLNQQDNHCIL